MKQPLNNSSRIESVDALRGFAVMAIVLVHNLEHFIYPVYPTDAPAWLGTLDRIVLDGTFSLFAGKAYAIFALLIGRRPGRKRKQNRWPPHVYRPARPFRAPLCRKQCAEFCDSGKPFQRNVPDNGPLLPLPYECMEQSKRTDYPQ